MKASFAKKIAYFFAAIIILLAIVVASRSFIVPKINERKPEIEAWASKVLTQPVKIDSVTFSWYGYHPVVELHKVTLLDREKSEPILQVATIRVEFSLWKSLLNWRVVPLGVTLTGAAIEAYESETHELTLKGFPVIQGFQAKSYENETRVTEALAWLMQQPSLRLAKIDLRYTDSQRITYSLTLKQLSMVNTNDEHYVSSNMVLHQALPTAVQFSVVWHGNETALSKINAKFYLYVTGLSVSQWQQQDGHTHALIYDNWAVQDGLLSAKIWGTWANNDWQQLQSTFQLYGLNVVYQPTQTTRIINRLSGNIGWKQENGKDIIAGDDILIDLPHHLWPVTSFYLTFAPSDNGKIPQIANIGYLDLSDVTHFIPESLLSPSLKDVLTNLKPKGQLENTAITFGTPWNDTAHLNISTRFMHLSFSAWDQLPGIYNLSGTANWNGSDGEARLLSQQVIFSYDKLFLKPLYIEHLVGDLTYKLDPTLKQWTVHATDVRLNNSNVNGRVEANLEFGDTKKPTIDLTSDFTLNQAKYIVNYLPMRTFSPDLNKWLAPAFLSGEVESGHAVLRGELDNFPYDEKPGEFLITGTIKDVVLNYADHWPLLKNASGKLTFDKAKMLVTIDSATIADVPVKNVYGEIPRLGDDKVELVVNADNIVSDFTQAMQFVRSSPLQETIGKMFKGVGLAGPISLKLGLTIPLEETDNTKVQGTITFKDSQMLLEPWQLAITALQGQVHFTENTATAKTINGVLFNKPLSFTIDTLEANKNSSHIQAAFQNHLAIIDLENWLKIPFSKVVTGATDVDGKVDIITNQPLAITLTSTLAGVAVSLPAPYDKKPAESVPFTTKVIIEENNPLKISVNYNNELSAALLTTQTHGDIQLLGTTIRFGKGNATWPTTKGIAITGYFKTFDTAQLDKYFDDSGDKTNVADISSLNVSFGTLIVFGQSLHSVNLRLSPTVNRWLATINATEVAGTIDLPKKITRSDNITARLQRLSLSSMGSKQSKSTINAKTIPSLNVTVKSVTYNGRSVGNLVMTTVPSGSGLEIRSLRVLSPNFNLQASGDWENDGKSSSTNLGGNAKSDNLSAMLTSFGFDAHNFIASNATIDFNLGWRSSPLDFRISTLSGRAKVNVGKGRIVDIGSENGAKMDLGRMLSIFSLQTIPRRLSLDFSDLFEKGYSFDYIRGDFKFDDGDAYTTDFHFDGPVARIGMNGRIGLDHKDFNLRLSVTPHVTSSIPIAATLLTGQPLVGVAAFAVNTILGKEVSKATTYHYNVTGRWNNPIWRTESRR